MAKQLVVGNLELKCTGIPLFEELEVIGVNEGDFLIWSFCCQDVLNSHSAAHLSKNMDSTHCEGHILEACCFPDFVVAEGTSLTSTE